MLRIWPLEEISEQIVTPCKPKQDGQDLKVSNESRIHPGSIIHFKHETQLLDRDRNCDW